MQDDAQKNSGNSILAPKASSHSPASSLILSAQSIESYKMQSEYLNEYAAGVA